MAQLQGPRQSPDMLCQLLCGCVCPAHHLARGALLICPRLHFNLSGVQHMRCPHRSWTISHTCQETMQRFGWVLAQTVDPCSIGAFQFRSGPQHPQRELVGWLVGCKTRLWRPMVSPPGTPPSALVPRPIDRGVPALLAPGPPLRRVCKLALPVRRASRAPSVASILVRVVLPAPLFPHAPLVPLTSSHLSLSADCCLLLHHSDLPDP